MGNLYTKSKTTNSSKIDANAVIAGPSAATLLLIKQFARTYSPVTKH